MAKKRKSWLFIGIHVIGVCFKLLWIVLSQVLFVLAHILLYTVMFCQSVVKLTAQWFKKATDTLGTIVIQLVDLLEVFTTSLYLLLRKRV